jgi:riboflavin synthase
LAGILCKYVPFFFFWFSAGKHAPIRTHRTIHPRLNPISSFTQGHVDGTATLLSKTPDGDSLRVLFQAPETDPEQQSSLLPYIIPKGYVAIDGTSLTITSVDDSQRTFGVMLIQHTQDCITLGRKPIGAKVNIEVDMVGKYVQKGVVAALGGQGGDEIKALIEKVVLDVLAKKGL